MDYPRQLTDRIHLLGNPCFSVYLINGETESALIETGISATADQIVGQIKALGVDPGRVKKLLITHAHADHCGGAPLLKERLPNLEVLASEGTAKTLAKEKIQQAFLKDDKNESERLIRLGGVAEPVPEPVSLAGAVDKNIRPGDTIDLGGIGLVVLDVPGHAPGGVGYWTPEEKALFCSDSLGFILDDGRFVANFYVNYDAYMNTFETLLGLDPEWICPGHSGAFSGAEKDNFVAGSRAEMDWLAEQVRTALPFDEPPEELVEEIYKRHHVGRCKLFTADSIRYCSWLLVRRLAESQALGD